MGTLETTDGKIEALRREVKEDIRELRAETHAGFAALRKSIAEVQADFQANFASVHASIAGIQASIAALRATIKTLFLSAGAAGMLASIFFTAGKALHWF